MNASLSQYILVSQRAWPVSNLLTALSLVLLASCNIAGPAAHSTIRKQATPIYSYRVIGTYSHNSSFFTEGLLYSNGFLYEGTGLDCQSEVHKTEIQTGKVLRVHRLGCGFFGEGITIWKNRLIQLTWRNGIAFVYDSFSLNLIKTVTYRGERWGLTSNGDQLIVSDGSAILRFLDPETFHELRQIKVFDHGSPVEFLNELEYVHGEIYANVFQTQRIARISASTGQVLGWIDLSALFRERRPETIVVDGKVFEVNVMNGIAYSEIRHSLFVTGKRWPKIYEIIVEDPVQVH